MQELDTILLAVGLVAIGLALVSRIARRMPISEPIVAVAAGIAVGPVGLGVVPTPSAAEERLLLEHAARLTLALGLMAVALRLPTAEIVASWRSIAVLIGLVMPLMWLVTGLLVWWLLALPVLAAALLGAILTPTDPIIASTIVVGDFVERRVPGRLRRVISAESGFNDGLAVPFVMAPLVLMGVAEPSAGAMGFVAVAWSVVGGVVIGAAGGYAAGWLLRWAERRRAIERSSFLAYTLAVSLGMLGGAELAGGEGLIAVFIAGLAFDHVVSDRDRVAEERVQEAVGELFILPVFVLFGIALPWDGWLDLGWSGLALAAAVLLVRRVPAVLAVSSLVADLRTRHDRFFVGWFGPIGVAALYYAAMATRLHGDERLWFAATAVIAASIVAHGLTSDPFIRLYASAERRRRATPGR